MQRVGNCFVVLRKSASTSVAIVDRPGKAVVGRVLVGTRARGGRGGRVLVGVHEPDIRVERVVIAVEHRQRDTDTEHEEHCPDREPRKRTLAAGDHTYYDSADRRVARVGTDIPA